jgi:hypothetical protein
VDIGKLLIYSFLFVSFLIMAIGVLSGEGFRSQFQDALIPFSLILVLSFIIGIFVTLANISLGTLFDTLVPKEIMGRTSSVMGLAMTIASPVGQVALGAGIDAMDPMIPLLILGAVMLVAVVYYRKAFIGKVAKSDEAA